MALTYPLAHPSSPGFRTIGWRRIGVVGVNHSPFTGQRQTYAWPGQWWEAEIALPPMKSDAAEPWVAWLIGLNGSEGTFLLGDSIRKTPRGIGTGTPLVKGASQVGYDLITDGWTVSQTGIMKAGDWVQLGSGSTARLHKVMADVNSNSIGEATLTLWPALRASPADNAALTVNNAKGLFSLVGNDHGWDVDYVKIYGLGFRAREVLT
jgi:hypothetical protein